jgi:hypothetical protein
MSPIAKGLVLLFGFPVILAILFFYFFMSTGEERMRAVCETIKPGMSHANVVTVSHENNLTVPAKDVSVAALEEQRNFSRHRCQVTFENGVVKSASYLLAAG